MTRKTVLVVDDDATARRLIAHILRREGYDVVTASDGLQAFEMIAESRPHAVVTDGMMPRMDGAGLLRMLRRSPDTSGLPVVYVTNSEDERDEQEAIRSGATAFLTKPVGSLELTATLHRALLMSAMRKD
jgi:two-component system chemotaxis response regulator CheY